MPPLHNCPGTYVRNAHSGLVYWHQVVGAMMLVLMYDNTNCKDQPAEVLAALVAAI